MLHPAAAPVIAPAPAPVIVPTPGTTEPSAAPVTAPATMSLLPVKISSHNGPASSAPLRKAANILLIEFATGTAKASTALPAVI